MPLEERVVLPEERGGAAQLLMVGRVVLPEEKGGAVLLLVERVVLPEERAGATVLLVLEKTTVLLLEDGVVTAAQLVG